VEVGVAYSWHSQGIRQEEMKKVTKVAARIIVEMSRLNRRLLKRSHGKIE
jgi:hypothetical protein